jgi:hypothetical protein
LLGDCSLYIEASANGKFSNHRANCNEFPRQCFSEVNLIRYELARLEWKSVHLFHLNASSQKFAVFNGTFLCEVFTSTESIQVKFIRYNLKVSHRRNIRNFSHIRNISYRMCRYVHNLYSHRFSYVYLKCLRNTRRKG